MMETNLDNSAAIEIENLRELVKAQSELIYDLERSLAYIKAQLETASGSL